eukprot:Gb_09377 [translate_table: standard]
MSQSMEASLPELLATHTQLAIKKVLLDEGYQEIAKASGIESIGATNKDLSEKTRGCPGQHSTIHRVGETGTQELSQQARASASLTLEMRQAQVKLALLFEKKTRLPLLEKESCKAYVLDSIPPIQCDSPLSGTKKAQQEKDSSLPTIEDVPIPKAHRTKRKNPPSLGGPARTCVRR